MRSNPFAAPATLRAHQVRTLEDRIDVIRGLVWGNGPEGPAGSLRDPIMRQIGLAVTHHCPPRNDLCELKAIFDFIVKNVRYTGDIAGKDTFQKALRTLQYGGGDCLPGDTLLFVRERGLVPLRSVEPGWAIWGLERWSRVEKVWAKGRLPVNLVRLSTGASFRATDDHHVYISVDARLRCEQLRREQKTVLRDPLREVETVMPWGRLARITVAELQHGDELPVPRDTPHAWRANSDLFAPVVEIDHAVDVVETFDLTTTDHRVYLPEADVTVSQCDDHFILGSTLAAENGFYSKARITSNTGATWDHIYLMAGVPKHNPRRWVALDTTLGTNKFGAEPGRAKFRDFTIVGME